MSATGVNHGYGSIGRMFARQNVPSVYGVQKAASGMQPEEASQQVDRVSLSAFAPRPLQASLIQTALETADAMGKEEAPLTEDQERRLREDRVFAAVSALKLLGDDNGSVWPCGIPAPTREELEAARRRLAQRPQAMDQTDDAETLATRRMELMEKIGKLDVSAAVTSLGGRETPLAAAG